MKQIEDSKLRGGYIGKILYKLYSSCLYFTPILLSNIKFRKSLLLPLYEQKNQNRTFLKDKTVVYAVLPETTFSGGLSDRLRGICAIYKKCKELKIPFRLIFEPLHLTNYLIPNQYNWCIEEKNLCWDTKLTYPCTLLTYHNSTKDLYQQFVQNKILKWYINKPFQQIHVYSNMMCKDLEYGELFRELFKPSDELEKQLNYHLNEIGGKGNYISCTFRFRQLLGDFKEGGQTLSDVEKQTYIQRCLKTVEHLHNEYNEKILVTADSITFLNEVNRLYYVYVIPGEVVHVGFTFDAQKQTYMKSFVDMFMISYASTVYLVRDKLMYHSGFPYRASLLNNVRYEEILLM